MFKKGNKWRIKKGQHFSSKTEFKKGQTAPNKGKKMPQISGENSVHYKGGRTYRKDGYVLILMPGHPSATRKGKGYIFEHRYVCEAILGRFLDKEETIHHINEVKDDNRPENLYSFPSNKSHRAYHILIKDNLIEPITESNLI